MKRPLEIVVCVGVFVLGAAGFLLTSLLLDSEVTRFPLLIAVLAALAVAGLLLRWAQARGAALIVAGVIAVAHTMIALGELPWGYRVTAGVLAAAHVYAAVLLMTRPVRRYLGADTGGDTAGRDDHGTADDRD